MWTAVLSCYRYISPVIFRPHATNLQALTGSHQAFTR